MLASTLFAIRKKSHSKVSFQTGLAMFAILGHFLPSGSKERAQGANVMFASSETGWSKM